MANLVDLRSDTVTRPSPGMRKAMMEAELGDDVFGDDPTVNRLQARAAEMFGFEAALLFPSGTQSNLAALMSHCGRVLSRDYLGKAVDLAKRKNLAVHLDGARIFNAATQLKMKVKDLCAGFDSVSSCLSKGLGAPAGTVLLGKREFVQKAKRARKILGGGMRQAGVIAAAGLYALENNVERLRTDHENAERLARGLRELKLDATQNTNMVLVKIPQEKAQPLA